jgi:uncharacterized membrane protein YjjP (DUF1212 family)
MSADLAARLDHALDAALLVFENGGSTAAAERSLRHVLAAEGLTGIESTWRLDHVVLSGRLDGGPRAHVRTIAPVVLNLVRAADAATLAERRRGGELDAAGFGAELDRIRTAPPAYPAWMLIAATAVACAAFAQLLDGDAFWLCALAGAAGQVVRSLWQRLQLMRATVTLLCALLSGLVGAAGLRLGLSATPAPTLVGSIIYLVPGVLLINGFLDLTRERFLFVGVQRLVLGAFLFLLIAIGVAVAAAAVGGIER